MFPLPIGAAQRCILIFVVFFFIREIASEGRIVCYYTNWSVYRPGTAKYNPQNINPYLCTHLIYAFGGFTKDNTLKPFDKYQDIEQGGYTKFTGLKAYNKNLKTLLAIGGWNEGSSRFSPLVANPDRRQQFIKNILKFLRQNHFDGIDLDWEYPAFRDGGKPRDKENYAQFVQELRSEFDRETAKTGRPRLLLTMAVPAGIEYIEKGFDIIKLNKHLDWFNILSYDYHSAYEPSVNHHSPLYSLEEESEYNYDGELNIDYTVKHYLNAGADRDKLVLGIPTYGRSYTLVSDDINELGSPADGPGDQGDATREKGYLAYYEICQNLRDDPDWTVVQPNPNAMGPYAFRDNQWVGYDDIAIVKKKAEYVAENGLGGIMFWSIDNDDFRGSCGGKPYPLIEAAKEALLDRLGVGDNEVARPIRPRKPSRSRSRQGSSNRNNIINDISTYKSVDSVKKQTSRLNSNKKRINRPSTTTTTTTPSSLYIGGRTTTPPPPTTPDPGSDFKCEEEGFFPHPRDCKKYFWCLDSGPSNLGIVAHQFTCPSGLYFNTAADSCDFSRNVLCKISKSTTTTSKPVSTTTTTTTTTTTNAPRITAATSRQTFLRHSSTTSEASSEEYEDEDDDVHLKYDEEEDPKVIKELIQLIKKVGGLEELEKQLLQQEDGSMALKNSKTDQVSTTASSIISKSLYHKVLSRPNTLNSVRRQLTTAKLTRSTASPPVVKSNDDDDDEEDESVEVESSKKSDSRYSSVIRNSRPSPQNAGIDKLSEFEGFLKEKPKYVTITRTRPTVAISESSVEEEDDDDVNTEILEENPRDSKKKRVESSTSQSITSTPSYVNIRRSRPTTENNDNQVVTEEDKVVSTTTSRSSYQSLRRRSTTVAPAEEKTTTTTPQISTTNRYKNIERVRPSTIQIEEQKTSTLLSKEGLNVEGDISPVTVQFLELNEYTTLSPTTTQKSITTRIYENTARRTTLSTEPPSTIAITETTTSEPTTTTTRASTTNIPITLSHSVLSIPQTNQTQKSVEKSSTDEIIPLPVTTSYTPIISTVSGLDTDGNDTTDNIYTKTDIIHQNSDDEVTTLTDNKVEVTGSSGISGSSSSSSSSSNSSNGSSSNTLLNRNLTKLSESESSLKTNLNLSKVKKTFTVTTTDKTTDNYNDPPKRTSTKTIDTITTNDYLGTVSSPRPFGFPRRRTRPSSSTRKPIPTSTNNNNESITSTSTDTTPPTQKVSSLKTFNNTSSRTSSRYVSRKYVENDNTGIGDKTISIDDDSEKLLKESPPKKPLRSFSYSDVEVELDNSISSHPKRSYSWKSQVNRTFRPWQANDKAPSPPPESLSTSERPYRTRFSSDDDNLNTNDNVHSNLRTYATNSERVQSVQSERIDELSESNRNNQENLNSNPGLRRRINNVRNHHQNQGESSIVENESFKGNRRGSINRSSHVIQTGARNSNRIFQNGVTRLQNVKNSTEQNEDLNVTQRRRQFVVKGTEVDVSDSKKVSNVNRDTEDDKDIGQHEGSVLIEKNTHLIKVTDNSKEDQLENHNYINGKTKNVRVTDHSDSSVSNLPMNITLQDYNQQISNTSGNDTENLNESKNERYLSSSQKLNSIGATIIVNEEINATQLGNELSKDTQLVSSLNETNRKSQSHSNGSDSLVSEYKTNYTIISSKPNFNVENKKINFKISSSTKNDNEQFDKDDVIKNDTSLSYETLSSKNSNERESLSDFSNGVANIQEDLSNRNDNNHSVENELNRTTIRSSVQNQGNTRHFRKQLVRKRIFRGNTDEGSSNNSNNVALNIEDPNLIIRNSSTSSVRSRLTGNSFVEGRRKLYTSRNKFSSTEVNSDTVQKSEIENDTPVIDASIQTTGRYHTKNRRINTVTNNNNENNILRKSEIDGTINTVNESNSTEANSDAVQTSQIENDTPVIDSSIQTTGRYHTKNRRINTVTNNNNENNILRKSEINSSINTVKQTVSQESLNLQNAKTTIENSHQQQGTKRRIYNTRNRPTTVINIEKTDENSFENTRKNSENNSIRRNERINIAESTSSSIDKDSVERKYRPNLDSDLSSLLAFDLKKWEYVDRTKMSDGSGSIVRRRRPVIKSSTTQESLVENENENVTRRPESITSTSTTKRTKYIYRPTFRSRVQTSNGKETSLNIENERNVEIKESVINVHTSNFEIKTDSNRNFNNNNNIVTSRPIKNQLLGLNNHNQTTTEHEVFTSTIGEGTTMPDTTTINSKIISLESHERDSKKEILLFEESQDGLRSTTTSKSKIDVESTTTEKTADIVSTTTTQTTPIPDLIHTDDRKIEKTSENYIPIENIMQEFISTTPEILSATQTTLSSEIYTTTEISTDNDIINNEFSAETIVPETQFVDENFKETTESLPATTITTTPSVSDSTETIPIMETFLDNISAAPTANSITVPPPTTTIATEQVTENFWESGFANSVSSLSSLSQTTKSIESVKDSIEDEAEINQTNLRRRNFNERTSSRKLSNSNKVFQDENVFSTKHNHTSAETIAHPEEENDDISLNDKVKVQENTFDSNNVGILYHRQSHWERINKAILDDQTDSPIIYIGKIPGYTPGRTAKLSPIEIKKINKIFDDDVGRKQSHTNNFKVTTDEIKEEQQNESFQINSIFNTESTIDKLSVITNTDKSEEVATTSSAEDVSTESSIEENINKSQLIATTSFTEDISAQSSSIETNNNKNEEIATTASAEDISTQYSIKKNINKSEEIVTTASAEDISTKSSIEKNNNKSEEIATTASAEVISTQSSSIEKNTNKNEEIATTIDPETVEDISTPQSSQSTITSDNFLSKRRFFRGRKKEIINNLSNESKIRTQPTTIVYTKSTTIQPEEFTTTTTTTESMFGESAIGTTNNNNINFEQTTDNFGSIINTSTNNKNKGQQLQFFRLNSKERTTTDFNKPEPITSTLETEIKLPEITTQSTYEDSFFLGGSLEYSSKVNRDVSSEGPTEQTFDFPNLSTPVVSAVQIERSTTLNPTDSTLYSDLDMTTNLDLEDYILSTITEDSLMPTTNQNLFFSDNSQKITNTQFSEDSSNYNVDETVRGKTKFELSQQGKGGSTTVTKTTQIKDQVDKNNNLDTILVESDRFGSIQNEHTIDSINHSRIEQSEKQGFSKTKKLSKSLAVETLEASTLIYSDNSSTEDISQNNNSRSSLISRTTNADSSVEGRNLRISNLSRRKQSQANKIEETHSSSSEILDDSTIDTTINPFNRDGTTIRSTLIFLKGPRPDGRYAEDHGKDVITDLFTRNHENEDDTFHRIFTNEEHIANGYASHSTIESNDDYDQDISGTDHTEHESNVNEETSTIRNTLIFLKGPKPFQNSEVTTTTNENNDATIEIDNSEKEYFEDISSSTVSNIATRRPYISANRIRTTTSSSTDENETENSSTYPTTTATTKRSFQRLRRPTLKQPSIDKPSTSISEDTLTRRTYTPINRRKIINTQEESEETISTEDAPSKKRTEEDTNITRTYSSINRRKFGNRIAQVEPSSTGTENNEDVVNLSDKNETLLSSDSIAGNEETITRRTFSSINRTKFINRKKIKEEITTNSEILSTTENSLSGEIDTLNIAGISESEDTTTRKAYASLNRRKITNRVQEQQLSKDLEESGTATNSKDEDLNILATQNSTEIEEVVSDRITGEDISTDIENSSRIESSNIDLNETNIESVIENEDTTIKKTYSSTNRTNSTNKVLTAKKNSSKIEISTKNDDDNDSITESTTEDEDSTTIILNSGLNRNVAINKEQNINSKGNEERNKNQEENEDSTTEEYSANVEIKTGTDEDVLTIKKIYSGINRQKSNTNKSQTDEEITEERIDSSTIARNGITVTAKNQDSNSKRKFSPINRRNFTVQKQQIQNEELTDNEDNNENIEDRNEEIKTTTRRTFSALSRRKFPTRSSLPRGNDRNELETTPSYTTEKSNVNINRTSSSTSINRRKFTNAFAEGRKRFTTSTTTAQPSIQLEETEISSSDESNTDNNSEKITERTRSSLILNRRKFGTQSIQREKNQERITSTKTEDSTQAPRTTVKKTFLNSNQRKFIPKPRASLVNDLNEDETFIENEDTFTEILNNTRALTEKSSITIAENSSILTIQDGFTANPTEDENNEETTTLLPDDIITLEPNLLQNEDISKEVNSEIVEFTINENLSNVANSSVEPELVKISSKSESSENQSEENYTTTEISKLLDSENSTEIEESTTVFEEIFSSDEESKFLQNEENATTKSVETTSNTEQSVTVTNKSISTVIEEKEEIEPSINEEEIKVDIENKTSIIETTTRKVLPLTGRNRLATKLSTKEVSINSANQESINASTIPTRRRFGTTSRLRINAQSTRAPSFARTRPTIRKFSRFTPNNSGTLVENEAKQSVDIENDEKEEIIEEKIQKPLVRKFNRVRPSFNRITNKNENDSIKNDDETQEIIESNKRINIAKAPFDESASDSSDLRKDVDIESEYDDDDVNENNEQEEYKEKTQVKTLNRFELNRKPFALSKSRSYNNLQKTSENANLNEETKENSTTSAQFTRSKGPNFPSTRLSQDSSLSLNLSDSSYSIKSDLDTNVNSSETNGLINWEDNNSTTKIVNNTNRITSNIVNTLNFNRRFQTISGNSRNLSQIVNNTQDLESMTRTVNGRRVRVLKFRRPTSNSVQSSQQDDDERNTNQEKTVNISSKRPFVRKFIRKRPLVANTTTTTTEATTTSNESIPVEIEAKKDKIDGDINLNTTRKYKKVLRKVRPIPLNITNSAATEVDNRIVTKSLFRPITTANGRTHLLRAGVGLKVNKTNILEIEKTDEQEETIAVVNISTTLSTVQNTRTSTEISEDNDMDITTTATSIEDNEDNTNKTDNIIETSITTTTTKNKFYAPRKLYRPTKPSISAITSTESTASTSKTYVRKFSNKFNLPKFPSDFGSTINSNKNTNNNNNEEKGDVSFRPAGISNRNRNLFQNRVNKINVQQNQEEQNEVFDDEKEDDEEKDIIDEEEEDDDYQDENEDDVDEKSIITEKIVPSLSRSNFILPKNKFIPNIPKSIIKTGDIIESDTSIEVDEEPEKKEEKKDLLPLPYLNNINNQVIKSNTKAPGIPNLIIRLNNGFDSQSEKSELEVIPTSSEENIDENSTSYEDDTDDDENITEEQEEQQEEQEKDEFNQGEKPEILNELYKPTTTKAPVVSNNFPNFIPKRPINNNNNKPRIVNRPSFTTIHPASLKNGVIQKITPITFKTTNIRTYERKYSPTSTESTPQDNNSNLEDLNINALNARNKKIFEINSRKHNTNKPKYSQKESSNSKNYTDETEITTIFINNNTITTQNNEQNNNNNNNNTNNNSNTTTSEIINNFDHLQENVLENTISSSSTRRPSMQAATTTTTQSPKMTTLYHIFALSAEDDTTTENINYGDDFITSSKREKLVEINRVFEVYSKEDKLKLNSKGGDSEKVESSKLKLEQNATLERLGEIGRVTLIKSFDSEHGKGKSLDDGGELVIEGRSTVADYTPTEPTTPDRVGFLPVRNSIPLIDGNESQDEEKEGRKLQQNQFPEVILGVETSTISLEGLFEPARKSKDLQQQLNEPIVYASSLGEVLFTALPPIAENLITTISTTSTTESPITTTTTASSTTTTTTAPTIDSTTPITSEMTTELPTTLITLSQIKTEKPTNYVRPLVPLLRPESNESSPLVISIANLDKVILSKVSRADSNVASSGIISTIIEAPKIIHLSNDATLDTINNNNNNSNINSSSSSSSSSSQNHTETVVQTQTSFSTETKVVRKKVPRKSKSSRHRKTKIEQSTT